MIYGIFFVLAGLFSILGAVKNWDFFMNNRKAYIWVKLFGRNGARIFYGILGFVIAIIGLGISVGILH
ncbi:MAG: immunity 17 family protein [Fusobacteriaceae bacterium]|jgi:drug/metabolite transporter superfamily protein YnfA|nr:immunity 17 family protein [Fusobacteriaceae bacterium]MBP6466852.1 immunity 17 family protein [Fusobacteriaceae bacterium]MBU9917744.1 immunity 17 family protein [Fusobacteriaceae bacterium]